MARSIAKIVFIALLVAAGSVGIVFYRDHYGADHRVAQLEQEKHQLQQFVERLTNERRAAELLVTDQSKVNGVEQTTLLMVEYAHDGSSLPPRTFTIEGNVVHVDAMVVKFDRGLIEQNDPMRGRSIALFRKLYGDKQTPEQAFPIDEPGKIPEYYRGADPQVSKFEQDLWNNFWRLADDSAYRQSKGVRIANGQGIWLPVSPDKLYSITIEADGGLNYTVEPLKGIYREALKQHGSA